jgi:preprotein translocase subunit YajC
MAAAGAPPQPGIGGMLVPFAAMFAVVYFLMIRPQQKKMKEQQEMLTALKHGDEVLTASGILGKVTGITDKVVTLEVADNVRLKMMKSQVTQVIKGQIKDLA